MKVLTKNPNNKLEEKFKYFENSGVSIFTCDCFCYALVINQFLTEITAMSEIDQRLKELVRIIQNIQANTNDSKQKRKRRKALGELWELLVNYKYFPYLRTSLWNQYGQQLGNAFEECFEDTKAKVGLQIPDKIDDYNSQRAKIWTWFCNIFRFRFIDYKNDYLKIKKSTIKGKRVIIFTESLDKPIKKNQDSKDNSTLLDLIKAKDEKIPLSLQLIEIINQDPYGIFSRCHIKNKPQGNYQAIALAYASGKSWKEIEQEINITFGTITSFFKRRNNYFKPFFKEYLLGEFKVSKKTQKKLFKDKNSKIKKIFFKKDKLKIINFQDLILYKIESKSWSEILKKLNNKVTGRDLIYFFLDHIQKLSDIFEEEFSL